MPTFVPGIGAYDPDLMCIGEAPGKIENETGIPFSGPTGAVFDECLREAGLSRSEVYITNVVKYQPPLNDFKKLHLINVDLAKSIDELWDEIRRNNPKCILAIGNEALEAVTGLSGIMNYRGSILTAKDGITKVVATIHPAALFKHGDAAGLPNVYLKLIQSDINRAAEESKYRELRLPERQLDIAKNSLDLFRFMRSYEKLDKCVVDIESIASIPVCIGFAFNKYHAISVPLLTQRRAFHLTEMGMSEIIECWRIIDEVLRTKKLMGHNLKYDHFKLSRLGFQLKNIYSDTLIKTRVIFPELPEKGLDTASSIWTREPYYKTEGKEFKLGKSPLSQLFLYNAKDCAVNFEVDEAQEEDLKSIEDTYKLPLIDYYYNYQMKKHYFYLEMENNGFKVDLPRQKELKKKYEALRSYEHDKLVALVGHEINVKSPPQKIELFKELKLPIYQKAPTSEDAIVKYLGNHCKGKDGGKKKEILESILEETRIRDQTSRYINFSPDYDKRCKSGFNIIATETCRSSTSVLKKPIRTEKIGLAFHTISKHGRLAKDIRSMFVPDKGKVFLQADSSQAEARVVAVLSRDWDLLKAFDTIDIHRRTAALILGLTNSLDLSLGEHISDSIGKDSPERFCGKKTRHAGNYDMKKRRFMTEFNTDAQKFEIDMSISEWKGGIMLDLFHAASPKIKSIFHREIQDAISTTRVLVDPFGGFRIFNGTMDDSLFQEAYANIPQRTVAHLVQGAALKIHAELGDLVGSVKTHPINFISENHDSLLLQVPENGWEQYAEIMKKYMTAPIDFSRYCTLKRDYVLTIPCDIEVSDTTYANFTKASKFKEMQNDPKRIREAQEAAKSNPTTGLTLRERMSRLRG